MIYGAPFWIGSFAQLTVCLGFLAAISSPALSQSDFEGEPINYLTAEVSDPVALYAKKLEAGDSGLAFEPHWGYLRSLLRELNIPVNSQTLVFSKTSMQISHISPSRPRAIYFNDDVYVGFCQNGEVLEIASMDPVQGAIFYSLKQQSVGNPKFIRDQGQCLLCHANNRTQNVPGLLVRSVFVDRGGQPLLGSGTFTTTDRSPMEERWGGWYVTGRHGSMRHMGNITLEEEDPKPDFQKGSNIESLDQYFRTSSYLAPGSDIVALMILEHQTQMHNAITAAGFETRRALHQTGQMNEILGRDREFISESADRRIAASAEKVVSHLLMSGEFVLPEPIEGGPDFSVSFSQKGPFDSRGRSLRELDLGTRLFRFPCSFLVYSAAFDAMPAELLHRVSGRVGEILAGRDDTGKYSHLSEADRLAIFEILQETKPGFLAGNE